MQFIIYCRRKASRHQEEQMDAAKLLFTEAHRIHAEKSKGSRNRDIDYAIDETFTPENFYGLEHRSHPLLIEALEFLYGEGSELASEFYIQNLPDERDGWQVMTTGRWDDEEYLGRDATFDEDD